MSQQSIINMMSNKAVRCIRALEALKKLKDLSDEEQKSKKPRCSVTPLQGKGKLHNLEAHLLKDILWESGAGYNNFCNLSIGKFEEILALVDSGIKNSDTMMRYTITSRVRLAITIRHIATGDSFRSLEFMTYISRKSISKFVPEVLQTIVDVLEDKYMHTPTTESEWHAMSNEFNELWQFPHTLGAIDGKRIRIKAHSGYDFYNNDGFFSIALLVVVDAHGRFIYIDVGGNGRSSDVTVYKNSSLYNALAADKLNVPQAKPLKGQVAKTPFFFIGDDIFGLDHQILKPYSQCFDLNTSQEVFNYRLNRARLPVEMALAKLAFRFRILHRPIEIATEACEVMVEACCILHNYLSEKISELPSQDYSPQNLPETITSLPKQHYSAFKYANEMRDNVCKYCVTYGDVPFQ